MNRALIRFARNSLALIVTGLVTVYKNDPRFLIIAPLLGSICKYLRDKHGIRFLPF